MGIDGGVALKMTTPRERDYQTSCRLATEALRIRNPQEVSQKSGSILQTDSEGRESIRLDFLNRECRVGFPGGDVCYGQGKEKVPVWTKILILHYLLTASGAPLSERLITFKEIPSGAFYLPAFERRTKRLLVEAFGAQPERLLESASQFDGKVSDLGDLSVTIFALPRIPITLVLWRGDDEFPPEGNVLFDETIPHYLPTEDIAVLSQMLIINMIKALKR